MITYVFAMVLFSSSEFISISFCKLDLIVNYLFQITDNQGSSSNTAWSSATSSGCPGTQALSWQWCPSRYPFSSTSAWLEGEPGDLPCATLAYNGSSLAYRAQDCAAKDSYICEVPNLNQT